MNVTRPKYRVLALIKKPFVQYDAEFNLWSGMLVDLLNELARRLEFDYEITAQEDEVYGHMDDNSTWHGLIGELVNKRADIGLGALGLMSERTRVVDMTDAVYEATGISAIMLKPVPKTEFFRFFTVLQVDVWQCIFGAYLLSSFLLWVFDTWSPYSYQNRKEKYKHDPEKRIFTLKESLWFCLTSLTPQGGGETPKNLSGRLVAATWWLFGFIIVASYTANLAAFLTITKYQKEIETFDDLVSQYKFHYSVVDNSTTFRYFQRMNDIEYKFYEIWKDMSLNDSLTPWQRAQLAVWEYPLSDRYIKIFSSITGEKPIKNLSEGLDRVNNESFALITEATDVRYQTMIDCRFKEIGPEFSKKPFAIALQKNSSLTSKFNHVITQLYEERWMEAIKDKWWKNNPERKECNEDEEKSSGIVFQNIGGVFLLITVGIVSGLSTLIYEYFYYTYLRVDYEKFLDLQTHRIKTYVAKKFQSIRCCKQKSTF